MVRIIQGKDKKQLSTILKKRATQRIDIEERVKDILQQVREQGDPFLEEMTRKFDCPNFQLSQMKVSEKEITSSLSEVPKNDLSIIRQAIKNIWKFHEKQRQHSWIVTDEEGITLGQMVSPVESVGLYVPGGQGGETPLISTLIMNAVPAKIAGVKRLVVVTPPTIHGTTNPYILACASLLGINEIYRIGSAWAIAALAFGTQSIPKVDMVVGPGNVYVTTAKKLLLGEIGIDMIAGPSEITIIGDGEANPRWIAADMLSQAEHDQLACSILITPHEELIHKTQEELSIQLEQLPKREIAHKSLKDWGMFVVTNNIDECFEIANEIAPEHLELHLKDPMAYLDRVKNAGCVFLGAYTPEALGDYFAGPNHVLPTSSTARFSSGLSVETFYKKTNFLWAKRSYTIENASKVARLARLEGLEAHARSAEMRRE